MTNIYVTKEDQLRYENENLKNQLWYEHKKLFEMFRKSREEYCMSEPKDFNTTYIRYITLKDLLFSLNLTDECESFFDFYGWQIK